MSSDPVELNLTAVFSKNRNCRYNRVHDFKRMTRSALTERWSLERVPCPTIGWSVLDSHVLKQLTSMDNACCLSNVTLCRTTVISPPSLHPYLSTHLHGFLISAHNLTVGGALKTQNTSIYHFWIPASLLYCLSVLQSYSALICFSLSLSFF